ncbi:MAG: hypothetical protein PHU69_13815 [Fermentimonas sp.]|nr:hypothetical protein [Fermentimonas sp.]
MKRAEIRATIKNLGIDWEKFQEQYLNGRDIFSVGGHTFVHEASIMKILLANIKNNPKLGGYFRYCQEDIPKIADIDISKMSDEEVWRLVVNTPYEGDLKYLAQEGFHYGMPSFLFGKELPQMAGEYMIFREEK